MGIVIFRLFWRRFKEKTGQETSDATTFSGTLFCFFIFFEWREKKALLKGKKKGKKRNSFSFVGSRRARKCLPACSRSGRIRATRALSFAFYAHIARF